MLFWKIYLPTSRRDDFLERVELPKRLSYQLEVDADEALV